MCKVIIISISLLNEYLVDLDAILAQLVILASIILFHQTST
jgi:hypothetical protein